MEKHNVLCGRRTRSCDPRSVNMCGITRRQAALLVEQQGTTAAEDQQHQRHRVHQHPRQFDRIGEMQKTHQLVDDPNAQFGSTRHSELDKMVDQRIIHAIEEPTYWVSTLTYVSNRDGSIRVCLDPRQLNKALIRP